MVQLILLILAAFILRISLSFLPGFEYDIGLWDAWSTILTSQGLGKFYEYNAFTNYTPGYLYILRLLGFLKQHLVLFQDWALLIYKIPNILADLISGLLIFRFFNKKSLKWAFFALIFYLFNPALIFNSTVWGQVDSFLVLFILASFLYLIEKRGIFLSALFFSIAFLVNPQALFVLPLLLLFIYKNKNTRSIIKYLVFMVVICFLASLPFFPRDPIFGLPKLVYQMGKDLPFTTLNAFNFWHLFGNWKPDNALVLGLTKHFWGTIIYLIMEAVIIIPLFLKKKIKNKDFYLAAALSLINFFLFPTRIHERYLLPTLPFLLLTAAMFKSYLLIIFYFVLSILHFLNLYFVYNLYMPGKIKITILNSLIIFESLPNLISFLSIMLFFIIFFIYMRQFPKLKNPVFKILIKKINKIFQQKKIKEVKKSKLGNKKYLIAILALAFILRIINIWHPKEYIFDEVYHGFTAQEMARGNVKAWEWWNPNPEGFAYEWTHPPLAKLFMAGGVLLFGQNNKTSQFAFRFPAVLFGVGVVYLVYLLGKLLFKNEKIGLLAALLVSFDGLLFVMSRIGMADVYFLFFLLLTIYLSLKEKYLFSGISLGLALATKWTGMYLYPVVGVILLKKIILQKKNLITLLPYYLITFLLIPFITYIVVYIPFFTSGHTWDQFIELQKQMWWYHTSLKATHGYQSPAWSWPFMWRPVWFWVRYEGNKIGNIYNLGNPVLWWSGLLVLPLVFWQFIKDIKSKMFSNLGFLLFCYFAFWLPWVFSPRIMFLHHYLPAIPFLCLMIGWILNKTWKIEAKKKFSIFNFQFSIYQLLTISYQLLTIISFFFFYSIYTGILVPKNLSNIFFWLSSWK